MPEEVREAEPRLALIEAYAVMYDEPARCKALLEKAFAAFAARGDVRRQLITAAAVIDCHYFEWADFAPLDRWIEVVTRLLDPVSRDFILALFGVTTDSRSCHGSIARSSRR